MNTMKSIHDEIITMKCSYNQMNTMKCITMKQGSAGSERLFLNIFFKTTLLIFEKGNSFKGTYKHFTSL